MNAMSTLYYSKLPSNIFIFYEKRLINKTKEKKNFFLNNLFNKIKKIFVQTLSNIKKLFAQK
jgi:hypothetical protein